MQYKVISETGTTFTIGNEEGICKTVDRAKVPFYPRIGDSIVEFVNENTKEYIYVEGKEKSVTKDYGCYLENLNKKKKVKKLTYLLLSFLLGGLGVHKFYSGKIVLGILYVLFCWTYIPSLIAIVEFFIAACKPSDENGYIEV